MNGTGLTKEDKEAIQQALESAGCLPVSQGKVLINISPERKVSSVDVTMTKR